MSLNLSCPSLSFMFCHLMNQLDLDQRAVGPFDSGWSQGVGSPCKNRKTTALQLGKICGCPVIVLTFFTFGDWQEDIVGTNWSPRDWVWTPSVKHKNADRVPTLYNQPEPPAHVLFEVLQHTLKIPLLPSQGSPRRTSVVWISLFTLLSEIRSRNWLKMNNYDTVYWGKG